MVVKSLRIIALYPILVGMQSPFSTSLVFDDRLRISLLLGLGPGTSVVWVVNLLGTQILELRNPFADVIAIRIELLALEQRIEDSEVRLGVYAHTGTEAPSAAVAGKVAVNKMLHKVPLALPPIEQKILYQEGGDNHATSVVHVAYIIQLPHGSIDNRKPGAAFAPGSEVLLVVGPSNIGILGLEWLVHTGRGQLLLRINIATWTYQT